MIIQIFNPLLKRCNNQFFKTILFLCLTIWGIYLLLPIPVWAEPSTSLEITGDGVTTPVKFTLDELKEMEQYQHVYSTVNTWPTKRWYTASGVKLRELLDLAGIKEEATQIKFISTDGYDVTLTTKELLKDQRFYFPGLKENHPSDGSIPGSSDGALEVEPILALLSAEGSDDPEAMNGRDSLLLIFGQRAVTEQTNNLFLKYVTKIEVLTTPPEKWDSPKASLPDGTVVPEGVMLSISNKGNNEDKIYYTTDGSTPTVNSPMFNWSASRWWPLRDDLDSVNSPIKITEDTVIKAITIGPGKEDSEVVTFTFTVDHSGKTPDPTKVPGGPPTGVSLDRNSIDIKQGGTFLLSATVAPFNADDQRVIWSSSDTSVATVDTRGLVTVVGPGSAIITVKTADGKHMATCVVNGPKEQETSEVAVVTEIPPPEIEEEESLSEETVPEDPMVEETSLEEKEGVPEETLIRSQEEKEIQEEESEQELSVPEGKGQYLAEIKDVAEALQATDSFKEQGEAVSPRVFEMSVDEGVPWPIEEDFDKDGLFSTMIALFFFCSGAGKKYREYVKEL
ncbi:MAG TPA: hypothetical protein GXZ75_09800 [Clostridia bacterium]|nr:hypothetical protein [Clostridia bacterium]